MKRPLYVGVPAPGEDPNEYNKRALASIEQWSHETDEIVEDFDLNGHSLIVDDGLGIVDENGNEQLIFQTTASAVNYWEMTNAATGNPPLLQAVGEANVSAKISSKGTGDVLLACDGTTKLTVDSALITAAVDIAVPDEAYSAADWNGSLEVPTKNAIRDKIEGLSSFTMPIGSVTPYAGSSAPSLWLLCYGQEVSRTTYAALDAIIGETYGSYTDGVGGAGTTHLRVPDLRGRVVAGQDDMGGSSANRLTGVTGSVDGDVLGGTGGAETHTLTEAQLAAHTHAYEADQRDTMAAGSTQTVVAFDIESPDATNVTQASSSTGSGEAHNNVQPTIILNYIIYAGV